MWAILKAGLGVCQRSVEPCLASCPRALRLFHWNNLHARDPINPPPVRLAVTLYPLVLLPATCEFPKVRR
jgi:hypothetical protein